jgi:outer membrane protein
MAMARVRQKEPVMRILAALILMGSVSAPALAQASQDTLGEAVESAISNNPTLMAERKTRQAADETLNQAQAGMGPQINLQGNFYAHNDEFGRTFTTPIGTFPLDGTSQRAAIGLEARQSLWSGGSLTAQRDLARAGVDESQARLIGVEQDLVLNVVSAFMDVRYAESELSIRERNVDALRQQVLAAKDRFEVGEVTRTDVAQAEAREASAQSALAGARARLARVRAVYEQVVGRAPVQLAEPPALPQLPGTLEEAQAIARNANPYLMAARAREVQGERSIDVAKGRLGPKLDLVGTAGLVETYHDDSFRDTNFAAGVELSFPLFNSGLLDSQTRGAQLGADRSRYERIAIERQVTAQVTSAWHQVVAAREEIRASASQVAAAEIALEGAAQELAVGERITLDVLDQERELLEARLALIDAQRASYIATHQLLAAMGDLKPEVVAGR